MGDRPTAAPANLPDATAQISQERDVAPAPAPGPAPAPPGAGVSPQPPVAAPAPADADGPYAVGPSVTRSARTRPYQRQAGDPIYRPLRVYTLDPAQSRLDGATAVVDVPYEPLTPGPAGSLFEVENTDGERKVRYARVDLDAPGVLINSGRDPSPADPQFHQQMVYAVCSSVYASFKAALGRDIAWGHGDPPGVNGVPADPRAPGFPLRLRLVPHAMRERNAYYAPDAGEIRFGYDRARADLEGKNPPGGYVFTCLSHDIVAHELSHALLHGLREQYLLPTRPDVPAFHEAFGDLVAVFQHFAYKEVVASAIARSGADLLQATMLADIARQFGYTTRPTAGNEPADRQPLRSAIDMPKGDERPASRYDPALEPHELGSVLVSAVFEAFATLFRRKTARYVRLAMNGQDTLPVGALSRDLQDVLAAEASELASQILCLCIRAVDYCPPVDLDFGDYLRAMITADAELVADDPWAYREALVTAFGRRGIFPKDVGNLSESSLRWSPPWRPIEIPDLHFARLKFSGDPARAAAPGDLREQAEALGRVVTDKQLAEAFGVTLSDSPEFTKPVVQSIRTARRVGPDGQVLFNLVAEVTQERRVAAANGAPAVTVFGGSTVIVNPEGMVRYLVVKNVRSAKRLDEARQLLTQATAKGTAERFWSRDENGQLTPNKDLFRIVHARRAP